MEDREKEADEYLNRKRRKEYIVDLIKENIIDFIKVLFMFISLISGIVCCVLIFIYRINNPNLTETEIILYSFSHYWWFYLLFIISILINSK